MVLMSQVSRGGPSQHELEGARHYLKLVLLCTTTSAGSGPNYNRGPSSFFFLLESKDYVVCVKKPSSLFPRLLSYVDPGDDKMMSIGQSYVTKV
jgi:hypothetical protein